MADFEITSSFDTTPIQQGMDQAAASIKDGAAQISGAFSQATTAEAAFSSALDKAFEPLISASSTLEGVTVPAINAFGAALDASLEPLIALESGLGELTPAEQAFSAALDSSLSGLTSTTAALGDISTAEAEFGSALDAALAPMLAQEDLASQIGPELAALSEQLLATGSAAGIAGEQLSLVGGSLGYTVGPASEAAAALLELETQVAELQSNLVSMQPVLTDTSQQYSLFAEGAAGATVQIAELNSAITDANGQFLLFTQAAADANGQLNLFETVSAEAAATQEAAAAAQAEATAAAAAFSVTIGEGVVVTKAMQEAIDFLNNREAVMAATSAEVNQAFAIVGAGAQRLGLELEKTAAGFLLVATSGEAATQKLSGMTGQLAYATARLGAYEAGIGQVGFALGTLGRASTALAPILAAAFPIIGAIALIEVVSNLIDKFDKMQEEVRKSVVEFDNLASSSIQAANSLEIQNLKLEDQISKLQGGPTENRLKEALLENTDQAQKLTKSLEDAIEKSIELLKTGEVGIFKGLFTGQEQTKDLASDLKDPLVSVEDAYRKLAIAQQSGNTEAQAAAQKEIDIARNAALEILKVKQKQTQDSIDQRTKELEQTRTIGVGGAPVELPALKPEAARSAAEEEFRSRSGQINDLIIQLNQQAQAEKNLQGVQKDRIKTAEEANAAEARQRTFVVEDPQIKQTEKDAEQLVSIKKKAAEDAFHSVEANARNEIAQAEAAGESRAKAEVSVSEKIITARKELTEALVSAEDQAYTARKTALEKEKDLIARTKVGPERIAAEEQIQGELDRLEQAHQANRISIQAEGNSAVSTLQAAATQKQAEADLKDFNTAWAEKLAETKRGTAERIAVLDAELAAAATTYGQESDIFKNILKQKIEAERQFADQRREIMSIDQGIEIAHQKALLDIQRSGIEQQYNLGFITAEQRRDLLESELSQEYDIELKQINSKIALYDKDTVEYERALKERGALEDRYAKQRAQIEEQYNAQRMKYVKEFNSALGTEANNAVGAVISGQKTLTQAILGVWIDMVTRVGQIMFRMIVESQLVHSALLAIEKLFHLQSIVDWITHLGAKKAATTANQATEVATHIAGNASIMASDAAVTSAYIAQTAIRSAAGLGSATTIVASTIATNSSLIVSEAGLAGAAGFASAMLALPFPVNVATAPEVMAGAIATTLANLSLGTAAKGALLDSDMPLFAHAKEMVLPGQISTGLQSLIASPIFQPTLTGQRGGLSAGSSSTSHQSQTDININMGDIHAIDTIGMADQLKKQRTTIGREVSRLIRSGHINPRNIGI